MKKSIGGIDTETVNLLKEVNELEQLYVYKKVGYLNAHMLSVVKVENRTLDFHIHESSDELFYVLGEDSFWRQRQNGIMSVPENLLSYPRE